MQGSPDRRKILTLAGAAAVAAIAWPAAARPTDMDGIITFEDGTTIPEGFLEISLEDPAIRDEASRKVAETRLESDGGSTSIAFALTPPATLAAASGLEIVARLERADGWLLARGSARVEAGAAVHVRLNMVMY